MIPKIIIKTPKKIFTLSLLCIVFFGLVYSVASPFGNSSVGSWGWPNFGFPKIEFPGFGAKLKGMERGRTNILILGSDYGVSTDTIIVLSIDYNTKQISTLTLPRDLQITKNNQTQKINSLLQSNISSGLGIEESINQTAAFVGQLVNQPIDYWAKINISGFLKVIDTLGGIDIEVENSFADCQFPTPNFDGYLRPCPEFQKGKTTMDSTTALIFARSRKSYNNPLEAIDFARSRRQSKVIAAVLSKIKSNPLSIPSLLSNLSDNLITDIPLSDLPSLFSQYNTQGFATGINNRSLDFESGIICPDSNSSDILFCDGDKSIELLHRLASTGNISDQQLKLTPELQNLKIAIISNGSSEALSLVTELKLLGFTTDNFLMDTSFLGIRQATNTSTESTKIYTRNKEFLDLIKTPQNTNSQWQVINETQSKYQLASQYQTSDVVVVIE